MKKIASNIVARVSGYTVAATAGHLTASDVLTIIEALVLAIAAFAVDLLLDRINQRKENIK